MSPDSEPRPANDRGNGDAYPASGGDAGQTPVAGANEENAAAGAPAGQPTPPVSPPAASTSASRIRRVRMLWGGIAFVFAAGTFFASWKGAHLDVKDERNRANTAERNLAEEMQKHESVVAKYENDLASLRLDLKIENERTKNAIDRAMAAGGPVDAAKKRAAALEVELAHARAWAVATLKHIDRRVIDGWDRASPAERERRIKWLMDEIAKAIGSARTWAFSAIERTTGANGTSD